MATYGQLPFGCRDAKIFPILGNGKYDTGVDVPRIRKVELNVTRTSTELEGDDVTVAVQTSAKKMEGSIEAGGINLAVLAVLESGTVAAETGMTGAHITVYSVKGTDIEGYFRVEAQAIANDGGDIHIVAYKVKATSGPTISFTQGAFSLTTCNLEAIFNDDDPTRLYDLTIHETATDIITTAEA